MSKGLKPRMVFFSGIVIHALKGVATNQRPVATNQRSVATNQRSVATNQHIVAVG